MKKYAEMLREQALREETVGYIFSSPGSVAHHNALAARYNECAAYLETIEAALRASTVLLYARRSGKYDATLAQQIAANEAVLGENHGAN